jgi:hypothetical protein
MGIDGKADCILADHLVCVATVHRNQSKTNGG